MTSPGIFTPEIDGVTGGVVRSMSATLNFSTSTCSNNWTDLAGAGGLNLEDGKCYKWTLDPSIDSNSVKPNENVADQSSLTSGILKVSDFACQMDSQWDGSAVTITYGLSNPASGIDCKTEFTTPKNVGKIDYLLVGGGGAGGWASTLQSQGGGGGGGGGTSFTQQNALVTPGRTYSIQVGAGAVVGTRNDGHISCEHGNVGVTSVSISISGGTSKFGKYIAEGGGCALDTGGVERGSDGGVSANGRTGGRGGSCYSRGCSGGYLTLPTTSYYTTAPRITDQLNAWEGSGGGGGANYQDTTHRTCLYGDFNFNYLTGCDGWDIGGVGAFGGVGGDGISSWYEGNCNFYFGGGGGGGGSTPLTDNFDRSNIYYTKIYGWSGSQTYFQNHGTSYGQRLTKNWMPLGGFGGLGGGGQAATSTTDWSTSAPTNAHYQHAQDGVNGCGGGGGGGQANKFGAYQAQQYVGPALSDEYGYPIFLYQGHQYFAVLDGGHNLIPVSDETIDSYWQLSLYQQVDNPAHQIAVNPWGEFYTVQTGSWYSIIGSSDNTSSGPQYTSYIWGEDPYAYYFNESYVVGTHHFTIVTTGAEMDANGIYVVPYSEVFDGHYIQYIDQNNVTAYLDAAGYNDFYYQTGYSYVQTLEQPHEMIGTIEPTSQTLDEPGNGGNGIVVIRFSLNQYFGTQYNPALQAPKLQKIWPNVSNATIPITLKQADGSGYVCISLSDPVDHSSPFVGSSSIRLRVGNVSGSSINFGDSAEALSQGLIKLDVSKSVQDFLIRDKDSWVQNKKLVLKISYSGSDSIATDSCLNSQSDLAVGGTPLTQYVTLERMPATQVRSFTVLPKNGRQNN
jgi:hypothetical protein